MFIGKSNVTYLLSLFAICVLFLGILFYVKRNSEASFVEIVRRLNFVSQNYEFAKNGILTGTNLGYSYFKCNSKMVNARNKQEELSSFLSSGDKIVLYFPENMCNKCFDAHVRKFMEISKFIGDDKFAVIVPLPIVRRTLSELKSFKHVKVFQIPVSINELDKITIPCIFTINDKFSVKDFFIPIQNDLSFTEKYLKTLNKRISL